jgi:hypothetical protein
MRVYCGDLNIHIGELIDFLLNDDLDRYKECVDQVDNPIISNKRFVITLIYTSPFICAKVRLPSLSLQSLPLVTVRPVSKHICGSLRLTAFTALFMERLLEIMGLSTWSTHYCCRNFNKKWRCFSSCM